MLKRNNLWKAIPNNTLINRIKSKFSTFLSYNIYLSNKNSNYFLSSFKLWKLILLILTISLTIHSYLLQNKRIQPLNIDYSLLNDTKNFKNFDEKFEIGNKLSKKCPISERSFKSKIDDVFQYGCRDPLVESEKPRANAAFVVLARNSEIDGVILSMRSLERRFNQWFNYPWIFLNDEPFTEEFETRVEEVASGDFKFGIIPPNKWKFEHQNFKNQNKYNNNNNNNNNNNQNDDITDKQSENFNTENKNDKEFGSDFIFFNEAVESQGDRGIMYGNMPSYHSMCRFYSGYFFEHPLVQELDWYWRVEPEVDFYCDLTYDPFIEMEKHGKKYGYTIAIKELVDTVPNLFRYTQKFIDENEIPLPDSWKFFANNLKFFKGKNEDNYMDVKNLNDFLNKLRKNTIYYYSKNYFDNKEKLNNKNVISNKNNNENSKLNSFEAKLLQILVNHSKVNGLNQVVHEKYNNQEYNMCHFWSNFEIASNEVFTSPEYKAYYDFLENSNGFFTERWGDAPIHSLAIGMFLDLSEIHYFRDIGYKHSTLGHCPYNSPNQLPYQSSPKFKHQVLPEDEILYADYDKPVTDSKLIENLGPTGCRCRCPSDHREIENSGGSCAPLWLKLTNDEFIKNKNNKEFTGGLGTYKLLDLDKIESTALVWLSESLIAGDDLNDWDFTEKQTDVLSVMYI